MQNVHDTLPLDARAEAANAGLTRRGAARVETVLGYAVATVAALLVVVEIVVLFAGVVSRYLLHRPMPATEAGALLRRPERARTV